MSANTKGTHSQNICTPVLPGTTEKAVMRRVVQGCFVTSEGKAGKFKDAKLYIGIEKK